MTSPSTQSSVPSSRTSLLLAVVFFLPLIGTARAQVTYTNSSTSGAVSWSTGPNWSATPLSASNTAIRFAGALGGTLTITQDTEANFVLNALTNANTGGFAMNFTGGAFEFNNSGTKDPVLYFARSTTTIQTFSNDFVLNARLSVAQISATASNSTIAGVISGVGGLRKSGTGYVYLTGTDNSFGGGVTTSAGTLFVGSIGNAGANSSLGTNGTIAMGDGSGANALRTINAVGEVSDKAISLSGSTINTRIENYSGGVLTINGAINAANNNSKVLYIMAKSNNVVLGGSIATNNPANNLALALTNSVNKTLALTASNAYQGGTTVWSGNLSVSNNSALGTGALTWEKNGSLIALTSLDISNDITVASGTGTAGLALTATSKQSLTNKVSGIISGTGGLRMNTADATAYPANLNNSFEGGFFLQQGTLAVAVVGTAGNNSPLGTSATIFLGTATNANSSATLKYLGDGETSDKTLWLGGIANTTFSSIDQSGFGVLRFTADVVATNLGPKTLILDGSSSGEGEIAGVISNSSSGTVSLTKSGTGTWTLSGTNTYTGATTVDEGMLAINGSVASEVTVADSATLGGTGSAGTVTVNGTFAPGAWATYTGAATNGTFTVTTALGVPGTARFRLFANAINDKVIASGGANLSGTVAVVVDSSYVPASGDTFDLVAGVINGNPLLSLPSLSGGLTWVTNNFLSAGQLAITSSGVAPYDAWVAYWQNVDPAFTSTAGTDDPDGDLFDNNEEFAFDGNPTIGTGALLTATMVGRDVSFSYVALDDANTATYVVQATSDLAVGLWTNSAVVVTNSPDQSGISLPDLYSRKGFVVPVTNREFYRVQAAIVAP
ncbi:MAG: autotransporter-associated beta strand repeat-containing protein [Verrucomicrobia bacterium]|nr:autotransporter-associated beta strand repeat-containing protein [Verrucomicrobiota bacterium]